MPSEKNVREPKQLRSIGMKEKILETALDLFYEKGYYSTTTNEIAKTAGISIGSLYSYFKNRDSILLDLLDRYHKQFMLFFDQLKNKIDFYNKDKKEWLANLVAGLVEIHKKSRKINKVLNLLYYADPDVAAVLDRQKEESRQIVTAYFIRYKDEIKADDPEAAAIISFDFISAIVDRIAFGKNPVGKERIIRTGIGALHRFLFD